jgi:hypothetical protein
MQVVKPPICVKKIKWHELKIFCAVLQPILNLISAYPRLDKIKSAGNGLRFICVTTLPIKMVSVSMLCI